MNKNFKTKHENQALLKCMFLVTAKRYQLLTDFTKSTILGIFFVFC